MKKIVSLIIVFALIFVFAACDNSTGANGDTQKWQKKYAETLQRYINGGDLFGGVYVADIDGDGIPTVALSTSPYVLKSPDIVITYVEGNVIVYEQNEETDSGNAVTTELYFIKGTHDFVFRSIGNTTGTFTANEYQRVYALSPYLVYEESQKDFRMTEDLEKEYHVAIAEGNNDISKYQDYIISEMNRDLEDTYGRPVTLINSKDIGETFIISPNDDTNANQQKVVECLNEKLGINLIPKQ